ncbi:MAG: hypothetical protein H6935_08900 [Thiobacillus sp.]|nr:hypothetical protein [Thiobacillus sp.]
MLGKYCACRSNSIPQFLFFEITMFGIAAVNIRDNIAPLSAEQAAHKRNASGQYCYRHNYWDFYRSYRRETNGL